MLLSVVETENALNPGLVCVWISADVYFSACWWEKTEAVYGNGFTLSSYAKNSIIKTILGSYCLKPETRSFVVLVIK